VLTSVALPWRAGSQAGKSPSFHKVKTQVKSPAGIEKEADVKTSSAISTTALLALTLCGLSSRAQEPVAPAAPSSDDAATTSSQPSVPVSANSKVRIVRLSEVKGEVQLDRQTGKGFEGAMANLPVTEGAKLKTGNGVAEVEFEDNSTIRVAPNSLVEFPRLELLPSGAKASGIDVLQGMVYVSLVNTKGNEFSVKFGQQTVNLPPDSHIRVQLTPTEASLAVLHGDVQLEEPSGNTTVGKNKTATFNLATPGDPMIAKNVVDQPTDSWDKDAVQYHKSYANASSFGNSPYAYGINDMNYYGSFINASGCGGSMWRPYFTSASWDPFGSGAWAYYPSAGYSWVSPYPWGWTPYHYGSWSFCQGVGWGWRPGGNWIGLANNSFVSPNRTAGTAFPAPPRPPSRPPSAIQSTLVPVNMKTVPASGLGPHDTFVFRNDSAGMGVPRGSLGKLNSFSGQTAQHGMTSTNVYYGGQRGEATAGPSAAPRAGNGSFGPPSAASSASSRSYSSNVQSAGASSHVSAPSMGSGGGSSAGAGAGGGGGRR
jgi:FecR protein